MLYPDIPEGRNKCLHRFTHVAFWFEWSECPEIGRKATYTTGLIPANVLLITGSEYSRITSWFSLISGSMITGGLSRATPSELANPGSVPRVRTGQHLRIIGQCIFFVAIFAAFVMVGIIFRKAQRLNKPKEALWWIASTAPFLILRGMYGILSSADWQYSYYLPTNVSIPIHLKRELIRSMVEMD
jgi:hypothetical protein